MHKIQLLMITLLSTTICFGPPAPDYREETKNGLLKKFIHDYLHAYPKLTKTEIISQITTTIANANIIKAQNQNDRAMLGKKIKTLLTTMNNQKQ